MPKKKTGLAFALSSARRREICKALGRAGQASPGELAEQMNEPLAPLAYHVRVLRDNGALRLVGEEERRGSIKHVYELDIREPWALKALGMDGDS